MERFVPGSDSLSGPASPGRKGEGPEIDNRGLVRPRFPEFEVPASKDGYWSVQF
jgi:hypothetical protein